MIKKRKYFLYDRNIKKLKKIKLKIKKKLSKLNNRQISTIL